MGLTRLYETVARGILPLIFVLSCVFLFYALKLSGYLFASIKDRTYCKRRAQNAVSQQRGSEVCDHS